MKIINKLNPSNTIDDLSSLLLDLLLEEIGDSNAVELVLITAKEMLNLHNNSEPIFRKGGKLQRRI